MKEIIFTEMHCGNEECDCTWFSIYSKDNNRIPIFNSIEDSLFFMTETRAYPEELKENREMFKKYCKEKYDVDLDENYYFRKIMNKS
jgi:hypothetical protein